jgi:hypothetical protein
MAWFASSFLCSSVQRKVLGDILRYIKAAGDIKRQNNFDGVVCTRCKRSSLRHAHLFALSEAFPYEAHLIVEALHSVLTPAYILRIFVIDKLCSTIFADEDPTLGIHNLVRVQGGVRLIAQWTYIPFVVELLGNIGGISQLGVCLPIQDSHCAGPYL